MTDFSLLIYRSKDEEVTINPIIEGESIWLTQKLMAELFGCSADNISLHLKNVFQSGELNKDSVTEEFSATATDGKTYKMRFYNLDAIISVGYRVNSSRATHFRIWATKVLKEYITKGFVLDDDRLKQGEMAFGKDYFRELLERVHSIRASERRIWQQITDIFAECSVDYDKNSETTHDFYAMIQNKFHYAITGQTAAEIIETHADHTKPNMGLTTWKNSPDGRILRTDVTVAKNLIENETTFTMEDFVKSVNEFLNFRRFKILDGRGRISKKDADKKLLPNIQNLTRHKKLIRTLIKKYKRY